jgi:hypothetical protein
MTDRVILQAGGASPLRASVAGADVNGAQFNDLIFDANQMPLRLYLTGFQSVAGMTWNQRLFGQNVREGGPVPLYDAGAGRSQVFMNAWRRNNGLNFLFTPSFDDDQTPVLGGGGAGVCSNFVIPLCFTVGAPAFPDNLPDLTFVNFCVFKNAN